MEKFDGKGFRDQLAEDLKTFRTQGEKEKAKDILAEETESTRYRAAKDIHEEYRKKLAEMHPLERRLDVGSEDSAREMYDELFIEFYRNLENAIADHEQISDPEIFNQLLKYSGVKDGFNLESREDFENIDWKSLLSNLVNEEEISYKNRSYKWKGGGEDINIRFPGEELRFEFTSERIKKLLDSIKETSNGTNLASFVDKNHSKQILFRAVFNQLFGRVEIPVGADIRSLMRGLDGNFYCFISQSYKSFSSFHETNCQILGQNGRKWSIPDALKHVYFDGVLPDGTPIVKYESHWDFYSGKDELLREVPDTFRRRHIMIGDQIIPTGSSSCAGGIEVILDDKGGVDRIINNRGNDSWYRGEILLDLSTPVLFEDGDGAVKIKTLPNIDNDGKSAFSFGFSEWSYEEMKSKIQTEVDKYRNNLSPEELEDIEDSKKKKEEFEAKLKMIEEDVKKRMIEEKLKEGTALIQPKPKSVD